MVERELECLDGAAGAAAELTIDAVRIIAERGEDDLDALAVLDSQVERRLLHGRTAGVGDIWKSGVDLDLRPIPRFLLERCDRDTGRLSKRRIGISVEEEAVGLDRIQLLGERKGGLGGDAALVGAADLGNNILGARRFGEVEVELLRHRSDHFRLLLVRGEVPAHRARLRFSMAETSRPGVSIWVRSAFVNGEWMPMPSAAVWFGAVA